MESTLHYPLIEEFQTSFENFLSDLERQDKLTDVSLDSSITKLEHLLDEERDTLSFRNNTRAGGIHVRYFIEWIHRQIKKLLTRKCTVRAALRLIRALGKVEYSELNEEVSTLSFFLQHAIFSDASPTGEVAKEAALILGECVLVPYQNNVVESSHITELLQRVLRVLRHHEGRKRHRRRTPLERTHTAVPARESTPLSSREERVKPEEEEKEKKKKKSRGTPQRGPTVSTTSTAPPLADVRGATLPYTDRHLFSPTSSSSPFPLSSRAEVVPAAESVFAKDQTDATASPLPLDRPLSTSLPRRASSSRSPTRISSSPSPSSSSSSSVSSSSTFSSFPDTMRSPVMRSSPTQTPPSPHLDRKEREEGQDRRLPSPSPTSSTRPFLSSVHHEREGGEEEEEEEEEGREWRTNGSGGRPHRSPWQLTLPCLFVLEQLVQYASEAVEAVLADVMAGLLQSVRWGENSLVRRTAAGILLCALRLAYHSPSTVYHPFQQTLLQCVAKGLRGPAATRSHAPSAGLPSSGERLEALSEWGCCFGCAATAEEGEREKEKTNEKGGPPPRGSREAWPMQGSGNDTSMPLDHAPRDIKGMEDLQEDHDATSAWPPTPRPLPPLIQRIEGSLLLLNAVLASFMCPGMPIFLDYTNCHPGAVPLCFFSSPLSHSDEEAPPFSSANLHQEKARPTKGERRTSPSPLHPSGRASPDPTAASSVGSSTSSSGSALVSLSRHAWVYLRWIAQHISVCLLGRVLQSLCPTVPHSVKARQANAVRAKDGGGVESGGGEAAVVAASAPSSQAIPTVMETARPHPCSATRRPQTDRRPSPFPIDPPPPGAASSARWSFSEDEEPSLVSYASHPLILETLYSGTLPLLAAYDRAYFIRTTAVPVRKICDVVMRRTCCRYPLRMCGKDRSPKGGEEEAEVWPRSSTPRGRETRAGLHATEAEVDAMTESGLHTGFMSRTALRSAHFILLTLLTWVVPEMIFTITPSTASFLSADPNLRHRGDDDDSGGGAEAAVGPKGVVEQENVLNTVIGYIKDTLMMEDAGCYASHPSSSASTTAACALAPCPEAVTLFATMATIFPRAVRPYSRSVMGPLFNKPLTSGFTRDVATICAVFPGLRSTCLAKILQGASTLLRPLQPPLPIQASAIPSAFYPLSSPTAGPYRGSSKNGEANMSLDASCAMILSIFDALHEMDFSGYSTLHFLCASILPFLTHERECIRRRAVELCFQLVLSGCEKNSPCHRLESGIVIHYGKEHTFLFLRIMRKLMYVALADMSAALRQQTIRSFTVSHDYVLALQDPERLLAPLLFDKVQNAIAATRLLGRLSWIHPGGTYPALRRLLFQCVTTMHYANPQFPKRYEHALTLLAVVVEAAPGLLPPYLSSLLFDVECRLRKCGSSFPPSVLAAALSCAGKLSRLAVAAEDVMVVRKMQYTVVRHLLTTSSPPIRQASICTLKDMIRTTKDVDLFFQLQRMDGERTGKGGGGGGGGGRGAHLCPYLPFLSTAAPRLPPPSPPLPSLPPSSIAYSRLPAVLLGCLSGTLKERLSVRLDILSLFGVLGALNPHSMKLLLQRSSSAASAASSASSSSALAARLPQRRARRAVGGGEGGGEMEDGGGQAMGYGRGGGGGGGADAVEGPGKGMGLGGRNWRVHMGDRRAALYVDLAALDIGEEMDSPHVLHIVLDTLHSPLLSAQLCVCAMDIVIHIMFLSTRASEASHGAAPPAREHRTPRRDGVSGSPPPTGVFFFGMRETFEEVLQILFDAIEEHEAERHRLLSQLVTVVSLMGRHIGPFTQHLLDRVLPYLSTATPLPSAAAPPMASPGSSSSSVFRSHRHPVSPPRRSSPLPSSLSPAGGGHLWYDGGPTPRRPPHRHHHHSTSGVGGTLLPAPSSAMNRPPGGTRRPSASSSASSSSSSTLSSSSSSSSLECILKLFRVLQHHLKEELSLYLRDILPCLVHTVQVDVARAAVPIFRFYSQLGPLLDIHLHIVIGSVCDVASSSRAPLECREEAARTLRQFGFVLPSLLEESPRCIHCLCGILKDSSSAYQMRSSSAPSSVGMGMGVHVSHMGAGAGGTLPTAVCSPRWNGDRLVTYSVEALAAMAWNIGSHFYKFVAMLEHILESYGGTVKKRMLSCILGVAQGERDIGQGNGRRRHRRPALDSQDSTSEEAEEDSDASDRSSRASSLEWNDRRFFFSDGIEKQKGKRHPAKGDMQGHSKHAPLERTRGEHEKGGRHRDSHPPPPPHRHPDPQKEGEGPSKEWSTHSVVSTGTVQDGKGEGRRRAEAPHQARRTLLSSSSSTTTVEKEETERRPTEGGRTQTHSPHSKTKGIGKDTEKEEKESEKRARREVEGGGGGMTPTAGEVAQAPPPSPPTVSTGSSMKHLEMLLRFRTRRKTTEDWNQWTLQLAVALLDSSPSVVFRQAALLAEKHNTFAQRILHAAFQVLYDRGGGTPLRAELVRELEEGLKDSREIPTEVLQELLNLSEYMERVWMRAKTWQEMERNKVWPAKERLLFPVRVLADCSERCHLYAKALRYVELQILDVTDGQVGQRNVRRHRLLSSQEFRHLIELCGKSIYLYNLLGHSESAESALRFIEANFARFTGMKPSELPHCIDAELLEKLEWWSKSRSAYAAKLSADPGNATYLAGYMRSIDKLGLYPEVLKEWIQRAPSLTPQDRQKIAPHAAHAAWLLRRWDHMKEITDNMSNEGYEGVTVHFYKAVVGVSKRELEVAEDHIQQCRRLLDSEISTLVAESYDRAYSLFVGIQQLSELEECILILKGGRAGRVPTVDRRYHEGGGGRGNGAAAAARSRHYLQPLTDRPPSHWQDIWERRLKSMAYEGWAGTLANHEFLVPQMEELHLWLQFAAMSRQHRYYTIANEVLFQLRGHRSVEEAIQEGMGGGKARPLSSSSSMASPMKASSPSPSSHTLVPSPEATTPHGCRFLPSLALASFQHLYDTQPQNRAYTRHLLDQYIRSLYSASPGVIQKYISSEEERSSVALCHSKMAYWLFKQEWTEEVDTSRRESPIEGGGGGGGPLRRGGVEDPQQENLSRTLRESSPSSSLLSPLRSPSLLSSAHPKASSTHRTEEEATPTTTRGSPCGTSVNGIRHVARPRQSAYEHAATVRTILAHLDAATKVDAENGLIWHAWGTIHTSMARAAAASANALAKGRASQSILSPSHREDPNFIEVDPSRRKSNADEGMLVLEKEYRRKCLLHVMEALKGYVKSLCLMRELEDALGCLSLWFEYGDQLGFEDGRKLLEELLLQVPTTVWLKLKPQIVARLQQKEENGSSFVSDSVFRLLEHVAEEHPHALLYTLIVAKASYALATQNVDGETLPNVSSSERIGTSAGGGTTAAGGARIPPHASSTESAVPPSSKPAMKKPPTAAPVVGAAAAFPSTAAPYTSATLPVGPSGSRGGGAAARLLQSIKKACHVLLPTLVEDAELVCREVVRCAATWTEKWLVAMERMKECEMENYSKTLRLVVRPLVLELSSPETESEKQFVEDCQHHLLAWWKAICAVPVMGDRYRYEVEQSFQPLHEKLRLQCDTLLSRTTELSSFSRSLAKDGRNLSAVVPGEYDAERADVTMASGRLHRRATPPHPQSSESSRPLPNRWRNGGGSGESLRERGGETHGAFSPSYLYQPALIACFDDKMEVLKTKQRPRRMSIHGTDGVCYHFLLKGQGDLRLDERVMQLLSFVNTLLEKHGATQQRDCAIQTYSVTPLSESAGLVGWVSDCNTMYEYVSAYRHDDPSWLTLEANTILEHAPVLPRHRLEERTRWLCTLRRIQMLELLEEAHAVTTGNDLSHTLWMRAPSAETWLDRRTTYVCSLATMSMVGHVMGLGDRHPSNILFHAYSGRVVHIDFGDCFEVAHLRKVDPENVPFRLTRMLVKVLEVGGIHGLFRHSCITTMHILRKEGSSILALLEAFVHDPLVTWGMEDEEEEEEDSRRVERQVAVGQRDHQNGTTVTASFEKNGKPSKSTSTEKKKNEKAVVPPLKENPSYLRRRRRRRETGTVLYHARLLQTNSVSALPRIDEGGAIPTTAKQVVHRIQEKLEGLEFHDGGRRMIGGTALSVEAQVQRLIDEACSSENVAVHYRGWCPFW